MEKIPVLVIDDHAGFRRSVVTFLNTTTRFDVVDEAANGEEGLEKAVLLQPRIVLLDIRMPGDTGLSIIGKLRKALPELIVVVLTLWDTTEYRNAALLENGADAYIIKENMLSDLLPTLNRLLSGSEVQSPLHN